MVDVRSWFGQPDSSEEGFTLIELIVYGVLLLLVLSVVGGIVISTQVVSTQVRESTRATTDAQLAADMVATSIRNSSAFEITDLSGDQLLLARTAGRNDPITWHCTAWYFSAADQTLRYTRSDVALPLPLPTSSADVVDWTLLAGGIAPPSTAGIFTRTDSQLEIAFDGRSPGSAVVTIDSSAAARAGVWETAPCF